MPINNVARHGTHPSREIVNSFKDVTMVSVRAPAEKGKFVIFGRVALWNLDEDPQAAFARLTTQNGVPLDRVDVRLGGYSDADTQVLSLQGVLVLPDKRSNDIIELRCGSYSARAFDASIVVLQVDDLYLGTL